MPVRMPPMPGIPSAVLRKGVIPAALLAALTGPLAWTELERWEGNVLQVYNDQFAPGHHTFCAGRVDKTAPVGARLTSDFCREVNKRTLLEYGYAVLGCANWAHLTPTRLVGLTMFAINVGKAGACGSQAMVQINAGNVAAGCNLIAFTPNGRPNWSSAGGQFVDGLFNRRKAERVMCLDGLPGGKIPGQ